MSTADEIRKAYKVHGLVQGVGFRWWVQHQGRRLGLRGTVRNCPDGSVEVAFAGSPAAVDTMCQQLRIGPSAASVSELEEMAPPAQLPAGFAITF